MMRTLRFLEKGFLIAAKLAKTQKVGRKRLKEHILLHALPQKSQIVEMRHKRKFLFSDELCTALKCVHYALCFAYTNSATQLVRLHLTGPGLEWGGRWSELHVYT